MRLTVTNPEPLIPKHGGYRKLKSFQVAQLVYDVTVRFCDRYISPRSRTHDQMVQAARSGVQNIAEGSQVSGTSKKMELKLTNVARASLEELRLDYEDFLRQRGLPIWAPDEPVLWRFKAMRCASVKQVRAWVEEERGRARTSTDRQRQTNSVDGSVSFRGRQHTSSQISSVDGSVSVSDRQLMSSAVLVANAALSLLNLACYLLERQLAAQARAFEKDGGFTERLYRTRQQTRKKR